MSLNDGHGHDVKDAACARVFGIGQFFITSPPVVGHLNLTVDLAAICAFEINRVFTVRVDSGPDDRVGGFLLCNLFDVERLLVADVKLGANRINHILHRDLLGRWASAFLAFARL